MPSPVITEAVEIPNWVNQRHTEENDLIPRVNGNRTGARLFNLTPESEAPATHGMFSCWSCGDTIRQTRMFVCAIFERATFEVNTVYQFYHENCGESYLFACETCNGQYNRDYDYLRVTVDWDEDRDVSTHIDQCRVCSSAAYHYRCERCGEQFEEQAFILDADICRRCDARSGGYANSNPIQSYSFKPRPIFLFGDGVTSRTLSDPTQLFLGAEIELEARRGYQDNLNDMAIETRDLVKKQAYLKSDGSLSCGFEVVTHPATIEWWREPDNVVVNALHNLTGRCKSYHSENCGMHVHMSKDAFTSFHLMRFLHFIYNNQQFVEFIAQRRSTSYARFDVHEKTHIVGNAKAKFSSRGPGRFVAVNLENQSTIELRVFKGNLEPFRILKNIEFCHALYEYTKQHIEADEVLDTIERNPEGLALYTKDLTPRNFKTWVHNHDELYDHLDEYLSVWKGR